MLVFPWTGGVTHRTHEPTLHRVSQSDFCPVATLQAFRQESLPAITGDARLCVKPHALPLNCENPNKGKGLFHEK